MNTGTDIKTGGKVRCLVSRKNSRGLTSGCCPAETTKLPSVRVKTVQAAVSRENDNFMS